MKYMDVRKAIGWFLFLTFLSFFGVFGNSCRNKTIDNIHDLKVNIYLLVKE